MCRNDREIAPAACALKPQFLLQHNQPFPRSLNKHDRRITKRADSMTQAAESTAMKPKRGGVSEVSQIREAMAQRCGPDQILMHIRAAMLKCRDLSSSMRLRSSQTDA